MFYIYFVIFHLRLIYFKILTFKKNSILFEMKSVPDPLIDYKISSLNFDGSFVYDNIFIYYKL